MLPTCSTEAIFTTAALEAHGAYNRAVIDLPGAFLHTEMNEHIIIVLKGILAKMMAMVDPKLYRKYIMANHKGQLMLCMRMHKALHTWITEEHAPVLQEVGEGFGTVHVRAPDEYGMARE